MPRPRGRPKKIPQSFETVNYLVERIPIQECISDPDILKKQFDEFSVPQKVVIKSLYGLPLDTEEELKAWAVLQGRAEFDDLGYPTKVFEWPYEPKKYNQMWAILGRRSGKSLIASFIIVYEAFFGGHLQYVKKGQDVVIYFVAQKLDIARSQLKFIESFIRDSPILSNEVLAYNADNIDLKNGIKIVASSPSLRGQRGLAVPVAILDESGFYYSDPDAANPDVEVENAIKYAQAQFPDYLRLGISSPWTKEGLLWKYYQAGTQGEKLVNRSGYSSVLVHVAPTAAMQNPTITRKALQALRQEDAMSFERESLAKFVDSISGFLPEAVVSRAVVKDGKQFRIPDLTKGFQYVAAMDPAFRHDSFAFCIVHRDHSAKIVLDAILKWEPRKGQKLNPSDILNEISLWLNIYNIAVVVSDQYQLESLQQMALQKGWAIDGVDFTARSKSKIYGDLSTLFNTDRIVLIDTEASQVAKQLVEEISRLEKTQTSQGTVHISAPEGKHDDLASAFALAIHRALQMNPTVVEKKEEKPQGIKQRYLDDYRQRTEEKEYSFGYD